MAIEPYRAIQPDIKTWSKKTRDIHHEKLSDARDIGAVRINNSRLNVFSSLKKGDEVDHFKFDVQSNGKVRLGMTDNPELRVEILNSKKKIIADGDANSGDKLFKKFLEMNENGIDMEKGTYYVRISRKSTDPNKTEYSYSVQLSMGNTYINDYDTGENPPVKSYDPLKAAMGGAVASGRVLSLQSTTNLLSAGMLSLLNGGKIGSDDGNGSSGLF